MTAALGARSRKARAAILFAKVLDHDSQGRVTKVLLPGSDGTQYQVILRRNGHISAECNCMVLGGLKPCAGNTVTLCYHCMGAVIIAARAELLSVSFCDKREAAEQLVRLGYVVYPVESWNAGPGRGLWMGVKGTHEQLYQSEAEAQPNADEALSEQAVESPVRERDLKSLKALYGEEQS